MHDQLPEDWQPGNNIWRWPGLFDPRTHDRSAAFLMLALAALSFITIAAALFHSGCARLVNRGEMFEKGVFEKSDSIVWETKHVE